MPSFYDFERILEEGKNAKAEEKQPANNKNGGGKNNDKNDCECECFACSKLKKCENCNCKNCECKGCKCHLKNKMIDKNKNK
jgi:hypothetical protein